MSRYTRLHPAAAAYLVSKLAVGLEPGERLSSAAEIVRPVVMVLPDLAMLERVEEDLHFMLHGREAERRKVLRFQSWDVLPFDAISPAQELSAERLFALEQLHSGSPVIVLATADALMQRLPAPAELCRHCFAVRKGDVRSREELVAMLDSAGFVRTSLVEEVGQMAVRGAVVDFFTAGYAHAIRVEFFGDLIESVRTFDAGTQRSLIELESVSVTPVRELMIDSDKLQPIAQRLIERAQQIDVATRSANAVIEAITSGAYSAGLEHLQPLLNPSTAPFLDYLTDDAKVVVYDELAVTRAIDDWAAQISERAHVARTDGRLFPEPESAYLAPDEVVSGLRARATVFIDTLQLVSDDSELPREAHIAGLEQFVQRLTAARASESPLQPLAEEIARWSRQEIGVAMVAGPQARLRKLRELLAPYNIEVTESERSFLDWAAHRRAAPPASPTLEIIRGHLSQGFQAHLERYVVIAEAEVFPGAVSKRATTAQQKVRRLLGSASQLAENDYVVHIDHGIALYRGLKQIAVEGKVGDFLYLEYAEGAKLFVPVENIGKVQKYIGAEGVQPVLTKLGGKTWDRAKEKVKERVAELAGQLVSLYAEREVVKGYSFPVYNEGDEEFADTFPFAETPDQQRAIDDVLKDMTSDRPMDRLVCGDVGYGKTEVALRAAFKAVQDGKQVAVLVPTTILAEQHYNTFRERFASYPFVVRSLSRFSTPQENRETLQRLAEGKVDVIIGTHRLLQRDVYFKDLGLLIIDEEHRFGVAHKEKLKRYRRDVDVLTLTATPIPRTLHMSLLGIRDLSVIETPPTDRHVIRTYIAPYSDRVVREAILREKNRSGQVFYLHNRVQNIAMVADEIAELVPEVKVAFAHGQMKEGELEEVMHRFLAREIDVLVSTTIIESGLDIPNANTMIIRQADRYGLAELYQLRGRVGRSSRRAYAYLFVSDPKTLGPDAKKRLAVLQSLDDLGVGFRLALQDMEIRGAGNLLGKDQSGEVNVVGYELYSQILKDAIAARKRGERGRELPAVPTVDPEVNIGFPAHIPPFFIPDVAERLLLYQRLVDLESPEQGEEISAEIEDRFGHLPEEVKVLLELMTYRTLLKRAAIVSVSFRNNSLTVAFHREAPLSPQQVVRAVSSSAGRMKFSPEMVLRYQLAGETVQSPGDLYHITRSLLERLGAPH